MTPAADAGKGGSMGLVVLYVCETCGVKRLRDMANVESADADADAATRLQGLLTCECPDCGGLLRAEGLTRATLANGDGAAQLRTEAHETNEAHDWPCAICGEPFDVEPVSVFLAGHGGELCPRCILAGPEKAAEIMRHYAQSERERAARILDHAAELDALAERLPGATPWVTFDEWTEKVGAAYREDGRMDAKQLRKWQAEMTAYKAELAARV